jgi:hypothetical protein
MTDPQEIFTPPARTGKEMCEYIAAWIEEGNGTKIDPMSIWTMSPTGELWPIIAIYQDVLCARENLEMKVNYESGPHFGDIIFLRRATKEDA